MFQGWNVTFVALLIGVQQGRSNERQSLPLIGLSQLRLNVYIAVLRTSSVATSAAHKIGQEKHRKHVQVHSDHRRRGELFSSKSRRPVFIRRHQYTG